MMWWINVLSNLIIMVAAATGVHVVANARALEGYPYCAWMGRVVFFLIAVSAALYIYFDAIISGRSGTLSVLLRNVASAAAMVWIVALFHFRRL